MDERRKPVVRLALGLAAGFAAFPSARGTAGPAGLRGAAIADQPTRLCVPMAEDLVLGLSLPAHFWVQCPRNSAVPTSLAGDGVIAQFVPALVKAGTHGLLYLGAVELAGGKAAASSPEAVERAARDFVVGLRDAYARVEIGLVTDPARVTLEKATVRVDRRTVPAWRTSRYATRVTGPVSGPSPAFEAQALLFAPPGGDTLAYVVMDGKLSAPSLDRVLEGGLSLGRPAALLADPARAQLIDLSVGALEGFPVRLAAFAVPAGFGPTRLLMRVREEFVWTADRRDDAGTTTGAIKVQHRDSMGRGLEKEADSERATMRIDPAAPRRSVDLATPGARAVVFAYQETVGERRAAVRTAVLELEDKVWTISLWSYDPAAAKADAAAFDALLASLQLAVR